MAAVAEEQERKNEENEEKDQEKDEEKDVTNKMECRLHMRSSALGRSWQLRALPHAAGSRCAPPLPEPRPATETRELSSELGGILFHRSLPQGSYLEWPCSC